MVAVGLLESCPGGYRNLELASRYLRKESPQSLRSALLHQTAQSGSWRELAQYTMEGCRDFIPNPDEQSYNEACEALACFAAPLVAEKIDLGGRGPVLLIGWGGESYRRAVRLRWPDIEFRDWNPFLERTHQITISSGFSSFKEDSCGTILLSGLLASCNRGQVEQVLEGATSRLRRGGLLALHDAFLPSSLLPPPEVVLGSLGRRIVRGGCRTWSIDRLRDSLGALGFSTLRADALPAGTVLVTAQRT